MSTLILLIGTIIMTTSTYLIGYYQGRVHERDKPEKHEKSKS